MKRVLSLSTFAVLAGAMLASGSPADADAASRAVVAQMQADEARHGRMAKEAGGIALPPPVPELMRMASAVMKAVAYRI